MATGEFFKIGSGATTADCIRPDLSPVEVPGTKARMLRLLSETKDTIVCEYELVPFRRVPALTDLETGRVLEKLKSAAASNAEVQTALAVVLEFLRGLP